MLIRYHWGLGIGHIHSQAHEHYSHPTQAGNHSILADLIEPDDTSEEQTNDPDLRPMEWDDVKETYGADVGCTEDGRNGRIGATRYAGGNGTRKEAEKRNV